MKDLKFSQIMSTLALDPMDSRSKIALKKNGILTNLVITQYFLT